MDRQDLALELFYGGAWQPAPAYVRDAVSVVRGRGDESGDPSPSQLSATLDNRSGAYNPRNAASPLYGLVGRNTPARAGMDLAVETFDTVSSSGWPGWTVTGAAADDFTVSGGAGRHLQPVKNIIRMSLLAESRRDVEQVARGSIPAVAVGASAVLAHIARRTPSGDYYWLRLEFDTGGKITAKIAKRVGGTFTDLASASGIPGLTYTAGQSYWWRSSVTGSHLAVRVWPAGTAEPADWTLSVYDDDLPDAGRYGLASWVVSGNTNTTEVRFDDYRAIDRRVVAEVASWKPDRSLDFTPGGQGDAWTAVEAGGILRRLGQGTDPLASPLRRAIIAANPTAYWPLEDLDGALSAQSAVAGVDDLKPFGYSRFQAPGTLEAVPAAGLPKFASGQGIPGSAPVIDLTQGGTLQAVLPPAVFDGWRVEWVMVCPRDKAASRTPLKWYTDGTWAEWEVNVDPSGITIFFGNDVVVSGFYGRAFAAFTIFDGQPHHYQVEAFRVGSVVDARLYVDDRQVAVFTPFSGTMTGTANSITQVVVNPLESTNGDESMPTAFGHLAVWNPPAGLTTSAVAMTGHTGEPAAARFLRLCAEEGVPAWFVGEDAAATMPMGPQRTGVTLEEHLAEIERTEGGLIFEPRDVLGLAYRPRVSLYNQDPVLTLDWSAGQVAPPFTPVVDDLGVRNDVTAKSSTSGAEARAALDAGTMSTLPPPAGVGRYSTQLDANPARDDLLPDLAWWALHLGTVDEMRVRQVTVDLAATPELAAAAASVDVGDRIAVTGVPLGMGASELELLVLGSTEVIGSHTRQITFNCVPASPYDVATADGEQRVPADGSTLAVGISASDMTLSLAAPVRGRWTTDPAAFPLPVLVGGELVTLSAITGTSSPQTATVSARGVNGVTRSWPAGTTVTVHQPAVVPL